MDAPTKITESYTAPQEPTDKWYDAFTRLAEEIMVLGDKDESVDKKQTYYACAAKVRSQASRLKWNY